jgi:8-hydroxy-5-deazaflavin:NADPH oxidoreductase
VELSNATIGVIGGTGPQGRGLAYRWARAGLRVVIGSRDAARAEATAAELSALPGVSGVSGMSGMSGVSGAGTVTGAANPDCAAAADLVLVAVPWEGHGATVSSLRTPLAGKIVIDCVNPLGFDKQGPYPLPVPEGSAAQQAAALLPESVVTAAFHHVSAVLLADAALDKVDTDVLVLGDDRDAVATVIELAGAVPGVRGIYGGRLRNAAQVEALTANLIAINRRYSSHAGIRITDI